VLLATDRGSTCSPTPRRRSRWASTRHPTT
jgi:hypothetical protein